MIYHSLVLDHSLASLLRLTPLLGASGVGLAAGLDQGILTRGIVDLFLVIAVPQKEAQLLLAVQLFEQ